MSGTPTFYTAVTEPINPSGASPILTKDQVWKCLHRKVRHAEEFIGGAIKSTEVLSETKDEYGREVVKRNAVFAQGGKKITEVCTFYDGVKVDFDMMDGQRVLNILSESSDGQLYLTYQFEYLKAKDMSDEEWEEQKEKWKKMTSGAVRDSVKAMRAMVEDGRIQ